MNSTKQFLNSVIFMLYALVLAKECKACGLYSDAQYKDILKQHIHIVHEVFNNEKNFSI